MASSYITEQEVSKLTSLSLSKLRQDRFNVKGIPYYKIGRSVRYKLEDIEHFMAQHRIEAAMATNLPSSTN